MKILKHVSSDEDCHKLQSFDSLWRWVCSTCLLSTWFGIWGPSLEGFNKFGFAMFIIGTLLVTGLIPLFVARAPKLVNQGVIALFAMGMMFALGYLAADGSWSLERALGLP